MLPMISAQVMWRRFPFLQQFRMESYAFRGGEEQPPDDRVLDMTPYNEYTEFADLVWLLDARGNVVAAVQPEIVQDGETTQEGVAVRSVLEQHPGRVKYIVIRKSVEEGTSLEADCTTNVAEYTFTVVMVN